MEGRVQIFVGNGEVVTQGVLLSFAHSEMMVDLGDLQVRWNIVAADAPAEGLRLDPIHVDGALVTFTLHAGTESFGNGSAHFPGRPRLVFNHLAEWHEEICKLSYVISEL